MMPKKVLGAIIGLALLGGVAYVVLATAKKTPVKTAGAGVPNTPAPAPNPVEQFDRPERPTFDLSPIFETGYTAPALEPVFNPVVVSLPDPVSVANPDASGWVNYTPYTPPNPVFMPSSEAAPISNYSHEDFRPVFMPAPEPAPVLTPAPILTISKSGPVAVVSPDDFDPQVNRRPSQKFSNPNIPAPVTGITKISGISELGFSSGDKDFDWDSLVNSNKEREWN